MQDGIDLITALAVHPETARRLARKFWNFFISDVHPPDPAFVANAAATYLQSGTEIRPVVRYVLTSPWFNDPAMRHAPIRSTILITLPSALTNSTSIGKRIPKVWTDPQGASTSA
jgi:uncharacterized protein (DUF1800 family)